MLPLNNFLRIFLNTLFNHTSGAYAGAGAGEVSLSQYVCVCTATVPGGRGGGGGSTQEHQACNATAAGLPVIKFHVCS